MVEGPGEETVGRGMVRQGTFTKEETKEPKVRQGRGTCGQEQSKVQEVKRVRRQWRSQGSREGVQAEVVGGSVGSEEGPAGSPILQDFFVREKQRCGEGYGGVVPHLRERLAEQGDATAQLEVARELLVAVAGGEVAGGEVAAQEELAMYWLLRAAEQGQGEARDTVVALAGAGRGVTEHNYTDVALVVGVAPRVAEGQFLGKSLLRALGRGQGHVTPVQLARRAGGQGVVASHTLLAGRLGRQELEASCCQYLEGWTPGIHPAIAEILPPSMAERILMKRVAIPLILLCTYLLQPLTQSCLPPLLLLLCSPSLHGHHTGTSSHRLWSTLLSTVSPSLLTKAAEDRAAARRVLPTSLVFHLLLLLLPPPSTVAPTLLAPGCLLAALSLPTSPRLLLSLLAQAGLATSWPHLAPLLPPHLTEVLTLPLASSTLLLLHLLPALLSLPAAEVQGHFQALVWEVFGLASILPQATHNQLPIQLLAGLGLLHATLMCLQYRQCRVLLVGVLALLLAPQLVALAPGPGPPTSLTWPEYQATCLATTSTRTHATCLHLSGLRVAWSGQVTGSRLRARTNWLATVVEALPHPLLHLLPFTCMLGEQYKACTSTTSPASSLVCRARAEVPPWQRCHLEAWATYSYSVTVRMLPAAMFGKEDLVDLEVVGLAAMAGVEVGQTVAFEGRLFLSIVNGLTVTDLTKLTVTK